MGELRKKWKNYYMKIWEFLFFRNFKIIFIILKI